MALFPNQRPHQLYIGGLILSSSVSIFLLYSAISRHAYGGSFYNFVTNNRTSVQIFVQIVSHLLGAAVVLACTSLLNFRTRLSLNRRPASLAEITWWNQIYNLRLNFNLPWRLCVPLVAFYSKQKFIVLDHEAFGAGLHN
jgi:hypothetical protein